MNLVWIMKLLFELPQIIKLVQDIIALIKRMHDPSAQTFTVADGTALFDKACALEKTSIGKLKPKDVPR